MAHCSGSDWVELSATSLLSRNANEQRAAQLSFPNAGTRKPLEGWLVVVKKVKLKHVGFKMNKKRSKHWPYVSVTNATAVECTVVTC